MMTQMGMIKRQHMIDECDKILENQRNYFFPQWKKHLGNIYEASPYDDKYKSQDLYKMIKTGRINIAARGRDANFLKRYYDLTIRYKNPAGNNSEWFKIRGNIDVYYYFWHSDKIIVNYELVNVRKMIKMGLLDNVSDYGVIPNSVAGNDDYSSFVPIPFKLLEEKGCIIKKR